MIAFLLLTNCSEKGEKVKTIHNPAKGRWEDDESKRVHLSLELTLGGLKAAKNQDFHYPRGLAINEDGDIFILDSGNNRIQRFDKNGYFLDTIGRKGQGPGEFQTPYDITSKKNKLFVADYGNRRVQCLDRNGRYIFGFQVRGSFIRISVDSKDNIYLPYYTDKFLVHKYSKKGEFLGSFVKTETAPMKGDSRLQRAYNSCALSKHLDSCN